MKNKIKILIADDHQLILDGIAAFLEKERDIEIKALVRDGDSALEALSQHPIDIAILDVNMPQKNGFETAIVIKNNYPTVKTILLTLESDGQYILQAMRQGIHGYVIKDKSKKILIQAIRSVFSGSSYWSPDLLPRIADAQLLQAKNNDNIKLSAREREIILLMTDKPSYTAKEIADELDIAVYTVNTHIRNAKQKLNMSRTAELIIYGASLKNKFTANQ